MVCKVIVAVRVGDSVEIVWGDEDFQLDVTNRDSRFVSECIALSEDNPKIALSEGDSFSHES